MSAPPPMGDFSGSQGAAATSSGVALELTMVGLDFVQSGEGRREGLGESKLLFPVHSHQSHKAI